MQLHSCQKAPSEYGKLDKLDIPVLFVMTPPVETPPDQHSASSEIQQSCKAVPGKGVQTPALQKNSNIELLVQ